MFGWIYNRNMFVVQVLAFGKCLHVITVVQRACRTRVCVGLHLQEKKHLIACECVHEVSLLWS